MPVRRKLPAISVSEASRRTGIPKRTLQQHIRSGHLAAHKFGEHTAAYVINVADLEKYLRSRKAATNGEQAGTRGCS